MSGYPDNRLAGESSPYLLLHKNNPVDWYPWGEEALQRARDEQLPIFLSVGYSTCYWCHVMERESFSDETIAEVMNRDFVNIKLDREERPDLDEIYMTATQVLTQHGGWPNSVFLTPDLKPYFAGTYFPPEDRMGQPGFPRVLHSMAEAWKTRREEVETQAEGVADAIRRYLEERTQPAAELPGSDLARAAFHGLGSRYDSRNGGFGGAPKFPTPANLLLLEAFLDSEPFAAQMLTETLDRMARGGLYDRLGGGFHRYATDHEWKIPHFEKMLYDNGLLLELYAREWQRNGDPATATVLRETVAFLEREMTAESGAFYAALDAETEGEEGAFYVWTREELRGVLGDEDFGFLAPLYGFDVAPFFEERHYVLHLPASLADQARRRKMSAEELEAQTEPLRQRLFEARAQRTEPLTDRKLMADWNGMAIAGVAEAGRLLPDHGFIERAAAAAEAVLAELRPAGQLLHVRRGEMEPVPAFLADYVFLVRGLLALHEATGDERWLDNAVELTREQQARLEDPHGGFFVAAESRDVLFRSKEIFDGAVPAGNSVAALNLIELARRTGDQEWSEAAARCLRAFGGVLEKLPDGARTMVLAAKRFQDLGLSAAPAPATGSASEPSDPDGAESPVAVSARWVGDAAQDGSRELEVEVEIADGWHINVPTLDSFPSLGLASPDTELTDVRYPTGNGQPVELDGNPLETYVERVHVRAAARPGAEGLKLEVSYQVCDESRCLAPEVVSIQLPPA